MIDPMIEDQGVGAYRTDPAAQGGFRASLVNVTGAALSLALVAGLGVWGYKLVMRDVSGVPVVRALEGPMRVAPDSPGGTIADHQGLAVNAVQADGVAEAPADRLVLAPELATLAEDDVPRAQMPPKHRARPEAASSDAATSSVDEAKVTPVSLTEDALPVDPAKAALFLADQIAAETNAKAFPEQAEPSADGVTEEAKAPLEAQDQAKPKTGLARSPKPAPRPAGRKPSAPKGNVVLAAGSPSDTTRATMAALQLDSIDEPEVGTRLVQLGAFDTAKDAQDSWVGLLEGQFRPLMGDKRPIIQEAMSGGRKFYRLRAMGFADLSDARRFCAALVAEKADCIPVIAR